MKRISCGVLITDGVSLVMGHSTNNAHWDIPKGLVERGEDHASAAVRETYEETGLAVDPKALIPLGLFPYRHDKDLVLFAYPMGQLPEPGTLICRSMVENLTPEPFPEFDAFAIAPWADLESFATRNMARCLRLVEPVLRAALASCMTMPTQDEVDRLLGPAAPIDPATLEAWERAMTAAGFAELDGKR